MIWHRPRSRRRVLVGIMAASFIAAKLGAQDQVDEIEILVEASPRLLAEDVRLVDGSREAEVLELEPLEAKPQAIRKPATHPWHILIYVDPVLSTKHTLERTLEALAAGADRLAVLGAVEVVWAAPTPARWLDATRRPRLIETTLGRLRSETAETGLLARLHEASTTSTMVASKAALDPVERRLAAEHERTLLASRLALLRQWLRAHAGGTRRALVWITDPLPTVDSNLPAAESRIEASIEEIGRLGWVILPTAAPNGGSEAAAADPDDRLHSVVEASAGFFFTAERLDEMLIRLRSYAHLAYRSDGGRGNRLAMTSRRQGAFIRAPTRRPHQPWSDAARRAVRLLMSDAEQPPQPAACSLERGPSVRPNARLTLICELHGTTASPGSLFRLAVASQHVDGTIDLIGEASLEATEGGRCPRFVRPTALPATARNLGVVVASSDGTSWGAARLVVPAVRGGSQPAGMPSVDSIQATASMPREVSATPLGPGAIVLASLPVAGVTAGQSLRALALASELDRVQYHLDGRRLEVREGPLYEATIDGPIRPGTVLRVLAFDRADRLIGVDSTVIRPASAFGTTILADRPIAGPGRYELSIDVGDAALRGGVALTLSWNDRQLIAWRAPPFRAVVELPPGTGRGVLRAIARSHQGVTAQDRILVEMPAPPASTVSMASLVELLTAVRDAEGRQILALRDPEPALDQEIRIASARRYLLDRSRAPEPGQGVSPTSEAVWAKRAAMLPSGLATPPREVAGSVLLGSTAAQTAPSDRDR